MSMVITPHCDVFSATDIAGEPHLPPRPKGETIAVA
jgi:hypothetical protein